MKKLLCYLFLITSLTSSAQSYEWMSSLEFAKKLALSQDKLLFVMWENSALDLLTPTVVKGTNKREYVSVLDNEALNKILWQHFVPVVVSELFYEDYYSEIKGKRSLRYVNKFNDDGYKIMDANGNILNTRAYFNPEAGFYIEKVLEDYAFSTVFLKEELKSYKKKKTFVTTYRLAKKYLDFTVISNKNQERELIDLAFIYIDEAEAFITAQPNENKEMLFQKCQLLRLYEFVLRDKPKKVLRELKTLAETGIKSPNNSLYNFLNFAAYSLLKDKESIEEWRKKVSLGDVKKVSAILNKN